MSGSFESVVRWNACVHRLDLGLYSHPLVFLLLLFLFCFVFLGGGGGEGVESDSMLTPREKSSLPEIFSHKRIEPTTLHQAGQRVQHTTYELFRPQENNHSGSEVLRADILLVSYFSCLLSTTVRQTHCAKLEI